jgi:hypothetical protein
VNIRFISPLDSVWGSRLASGVHLELRLGIVSTAANYWLHQLLPVLRAALDDLGVLPERDGDGLERGAIESKGSRILIINGTERRRLRPKKAINRGLSPPARRGKT